MEKIFFTDFTCMYIIAWKGAAPTGTRKRAGSTTEELPSKRSKQGIISLFILLTIVIIPFSAVTQPTVTLTTQPASNKKGN